MQSLMAEGEDGYWPPWSDNNDNPTQEFWQLPPNWEAPYPSQTDKEEAKRCWHAMLYYWGRHTLEPETLFYVGVSPETGLGLYAKRNGPITLDETNEDLHGFLELLQEEEYQFLLSIQYPSLWEVHEGNKAVLFGHVSLINHSAGISSLSFRSVTAEGVSSQYQLQIACLQCWSTPDGENADDSDNIQVRRRLNLFFCE